MASTPRSRICWGHQGPDPGSAEVMRWLQHPDPGSAGGIKGRIPARSHGGAGPVRTSSFMWTCCMPAYKILDFNCFNYYLFIYLL